MVPRMEVVGEFCVRLSTLSLTETQTGAFLSMTVFMWEKMKSI